MPRGKGFYSGGNNYGFDTAKAASPETGEAFVAAYIPVNVSSHDSDYAIREALDQFTYINDHTLDSTTRAFLKSVCDWQLRQPWTEKQRVAIAAVLRGKSRMRLSVSQRAALRAAVNNHENKSRLLGSVDANRMQQDELVQAATTLGIDINATVNASSRNAFASWNNGAKRGAGSSTDTAHQAESGTTSAEVERLADDIGRAHDRLDVHDTQLGTLRSSVDKLALEVASSRTLVITGDTIPTHEITGHKHPQFEKLVRILASVDPAGRHPNVWIAGPTGSGKTFAAEQAAEALGVSYGFHGAMNMPHDLVGFVDAGGTYHETQFVRLYRNGGLCLLDEIDAASNEATLALNAALAGSSMSLPNGEIIARHPDFRCVGAGNTWGAGATAEYVGRNKLDAAFMSRFPVRLHWDYDHALERSMCGVDAAEWLELVHRARKYVADSGLKVIIDPRVSLAGAALLRAGFTENEAAEMTFLSSMKPDQARAVKIAMRGIEF